jgi:hypothetical protein
MTCSPASWGVRPDRLRGIVARWRNAGYVQTGRLGPGPAWCWLTRSGLGVTGQRFAPSRPALGRLAHVRAVLAIRLSLQDSEVYRAGRAWWRSERRIRAAAGGRVGGSHVPDAEVSWPDLIGSTYAGQCWAIEAELTPKPLARTTAIMHGLLARASDYQPGARPGPGPRYPPHHLRPRRRPARSHPPVLRRTRLRPDRAELLAADLPASAADDQARRDRQAAALAKRLRQIHAAENAHAREIEALAHL